MKNGSVATLVMFTLVLTACGAATGPGAGSTAAPTSTGSPTTDPPPPSTTTVISPTTTVPQIGCGAAGLPSVSTEQGLPDAVAKLRGAIVAAAVACDFEGLAALTSSDFTYSFGGDGDPAGYWQSREIDSATTGAVSPLTMLVQVLDLPYGTIDDGEGVTYYAWPSAHTYESWDAVPQADREALIGLYGAQDLADFEAFGGYSGYRVGITETGEWTSFVAGD